MSKLPATQHIDDKSALLKKRPRNAQQTNTQDSSGQQSPITTLQNQVGNAAVQRLLAQRSGDGPTELDDDTANRINSARGGGQSLDTTVQQKMGGAMGSDFSGVRVHTGSESNQLNEQLGAKAFTTGNDVFFRDGEYNPNSSSGQELIAHELTHVVQQGSGAVPSSGKMAVNAPGDQFEQEADSVAKQVSNGGMAPGVQRQEEPEEEVQPMRIQREDMPEEEVQAMHLQRQETPEEEEPVQPMRVQREDVPEEEPVQAMHVQRQEAPEEEEPVQPMRIQREDMPEEEEVQAKHVQLEEMPEEEPAE